MSHWQVPKENHSGKQEVGIIIKKMYFKSLSVIGKMVCENMQSLSVIGKWSVKYAVTFCYR